MQPVLLVIQFLLAIALIAIILIQRTSQDGGGLMGGGSTMGGLFTARGSANLLTRATAVLATLFIINSLALGYIASRDHRAEAHSIADQMPAAPAMPAAPVPVPEKTPEMPKPPEVPLAK